MKRMKKLVAIMGSPHRNGNCSACVDAILEGAKQAGIESKKLILKDYDIGYCIGCRRCVETAKCVLQDDMDEVLGMVKDADIVLIATPIYICQVNALTKNFLDRMLPLTDSHHKPRFGRKKLIMVYTYGAPIPFLFRQYIRLCGKSLKAMGLEIQKNLVISGCMELDSMKRNPNKIEKLVRFGRNL